MKNPQTLATCATALALGTALLGGCATGNSHSSAHHADHADSPLSQTFAAHGGLDQWESNAQYHFEIKDFPMPWGLNNEAHIIDLDQRRANVRDTGSGYTIRWDGESSTVGPAADSFKGPADFWAMGPFYFAGMPFVFADQGVNVTSLGQDTFGGQTYDHYKASFTVGNSPKDEYRIWVNPATHVLEIIEFRVTHPAVQGDKPLSEAIREYLVFENWEAVNGLVVPSRGTFYLSDGHFKQLGEKVGTYTTSKIAFNKTPASDALFENK